jgi:Protein of unknown function (DUF2934)
MARNKKPRRGLTTAALVEVAEEMAKPRFAESARHGVAGFGRALPTRDAITHLAYTLYLARGGKHGRDVEDWARAEKELSHELIEQPQTARVIHPSRPIGFE